jgi:hypothetical protein
MFSRAGNSLIVDCLSISMLNMEKCIDSDVGVGSEVTAVT